MKAGQARKTRPKKRSGRTSAKRRALALLAEWAKERTTVEFVDPNGLAHPGQLLHLPSDEDFGEFMFEGNSGVRTLVSALLWTGVTIDPGIGCIGESVHVEEGSRRFGLRPELRTDKDVVRRNAADKQLADWCKAEAQLRFMCRFPVGGLVFVGSVVNVVDANFVVESLPAVGTASPRFVFLLSDATCKLSEEDGYVSLTVHWRSKPGYVVRIWEGDDTIADLLERFPASTLPN